MATLCNIFLEKEKIETTKRLRIGDPIASHHAILQLKLKGIQVDEEKTINDPELLMEVVFFFILTYTFYL